MMTISRFSSLLVILMVFGVFRSEDQIEATAKDRDREMKTIRSV